MAVDLAWFHIKFDSLPTIDSREEILSEINVALCGLPFTGVKQVANSVHFDSVFSSLNTSNAAQLEVACDILRKLLSAVEPNKVLSQYSSHVQHALNHQSLKVKEVILKQLNTLTDNAEIIERFSQENDLITVVIQCIADEISVAQLAVAILTKLGENAAGLKVLYNPNNLKALRETMTKGDVIRFRVYELVVNVSTNSPEGLQASAACELLPALLGELKQNDILITLSALALLTPLALVPSGLSFLDQNGVLDELESSLDSVHKDPLGSILLPGVVKFFGNIAQRMPDEIIPRFPKAVSVVFDTVQSNDPTQVAVAVETIGYIATTLKGKYALQQLGNQVPSLLHSVVERMASFPLDVKVRILNSVASLLHLEPGDINNQSEGLTLSWAKALHQQPMDYIVSVTKQPFQDIRLAAFKILQVIAAQTWGQEKIINTPGLIEFLLDRSTESFKDCVVAKFEVVKILVSSATSLSILGPQVYERLQKFVNEGEFYVRAETEVAIGESS